MKLDLLCIGKLKEHSVRDWSSEFLKRLTKYCRLDVTELKESTPDKEAADILKRIRDDDYVIVFDSAGNALTSEEFARVIKRQTLEHHVVLVIGGPNGLSATVKKRANFTVSFGKATFSHQLARIIVLEQTYRAFTIIKGEPYHK